MVQVRAKLHVPVSTSSDVEIALHLVQIQAPKDSARIGRRAAQLGRLGPARALPTQPHNIMHVLLTKALFVAMQRHPALASDNAALCVAVELVDALVVDPVRPDGGLALEPVRSQDSVARGILHVDVEVGALHAHHHVHVDLQVVAHTLLDRERVVLGAAPPARELRPYEDSGYEDHRNGPFAAARGSGYVLGFGLGCARTRGSTLAWLRLE